MTDKISISIFVDGDETHFLDTIKEIWSTHWDANYAELGELIFNEPINIKEQAGINALPKSLTSAFEIRNPDIFFAAKIGDKTLPLGGIEITAHSPDGSNVEKRYPFIWAGRKYGFTAFIVSPYMKARPGGQVNKLPNRHSVRNLDFLDEWKKKNSCTAPLYQIIPIKELQEDYQRAKAFLGRDLFEWTDLSIYFCNLLAESVKPGASQKKLYEFVERLNQLAAACKAVTRFTKPTSFIERGNRWIQIYNTRPDSGHWERGEGQFDSIDGRLMFTLDEASLKGLNKSLEFWMPQLSSKHPWIVEQVERDHGSKRLRNIVKVLKNHMTVKFADDLTVDDLKILEENAGLTLERLDWKSDVISIKSLLGQSDPQQVARTGLKSPSNQTIAGIHSVLANTSMFISTHRLYESGWASSLENAVLMAPVGSTVIAPRIPKSQLQGVMNFGNRTVIFAEECTKYQLLAIRQLHRHCFE